MRMSGWIPISISSRTECCVGLVLSSPAAAMYGTQREVDEDRVLAPDVVAELADRLEERQRLDVAHRAADLDDHDVVLGRERRIAALISSVMCGITCTVEPRILAAPFLGDDVEVDAAGGDVVRLRERAIDEALVVAEVEVRLGAVVGDEHLAVLERRHRARIDVDVRIELHHR